MNSFCPFLPNPSAIFAGIDDIHVITPKIATPACRQAGRYASRNDPPRRVNS